MIARYLGGGPEFKAFRDVGESRCVTENDDTVPNQSRHSFFPWQALASREI